jgi:hypothetical protein
MQNGPAWEVAVEHALTCILELPDDWDEDGGEPIDPRVKAVTLTLLRAIMQPNSPTPDVLPVPNGWVQLEWHSRKVHFQIKVERPDRYAAYYYDYQTGREWEQEVCFAPAGLRLLSRAVAKLTDNTPAPTGEQGTMASETSYQIINRCARELGLAFPLTDEDVDRFCEKVKAAKLSQDECQAIMAKLRATKTEPPK